MTVHDPTVSVAARVRKTAATMADGRDLIYFDDSPPYADRRRTRDLVDTRPLTPASSQAQLRYDPLTGEWVAIAAPRMDRTFLPPADVCPLCPTGPGTGDRDPRQRLRRGGVREPVPVASRPAGHQPPAPRRRRTAVAVRSRRSAAVRCVCFTSDHDSTFATLTRRPGPHGHRGLGRPHRGAVGDARRRAGVLLREPRRRDRRHADPPARPDLRIPVCDRRAPSASSRWPREHRERTGGNLLPTSWTPSAARAARGPDRRALERIRARPPHAGRSSCTSPRTATSPTSRH